MKHLVVAIAVCFGTAGAAQDVDCETDTSQRAVDICAGQALALAELEMSEAFEEAVVVAQRQDEAGEGGLEERLRAAQAAWVIYRDAACEARAYQEESNLSTMTRTRCMTGLTWLQTEYIMTFAGMWP